MGFRVVKTSWLCSIFMGTCCFIVEDGEVCLGLCTENQHTPAFVLHMRRLASPARPIFAAILPQALLSLHGWSCHARPSKRQGTVFSMASGPDAQLPLVVSVSQLVRDAELAELDPVSPS